MSWYPQGYVVEAFCLGHEKCVLLFVLLLQLLYLSKRYISAIHIPPFARGCLISGGGDPVLKVWDWTTGRLERNVQIFDVVQPFIMVKASKRRRKLQEDDHHGDVVEDDKSKGRQKRKGKPKQDTPSNDTEDPSKAVETETVLVVRRISSFISDSGSFVVFSALGYATYHFAVYSSHARSNQSDGTIRIFPGGR